MDRVLELFESSLSEWWREEFGGTEWKEDFFTPPQKEAIPLINQGKNVLIAAPTGSGKCVKPDTPIIIEEKENVKIVRAKDLLDKRKQKILEFKGEGKLYKSDIFSLSFNGKNIDKRNSNIYSEHYSGEIYEIKTNHGRKIEITPEHPLLVNIKGGFEWRKVKNIEKGEKIGLPRKVDLPKHQTEFETDDIIRNINGKSNLRLKCQDTKDLKFLSGNTESFEKIEKEKLNKIFQLTDLSLKQIYKKFNKDVSNISSSKNTSENKNKFQYIKEKTVVEENNQIIINKEDKSLFKVPKKIDRDIAKFYAFLINQGKINFSEDSLVLFKDKKKIFKDIKYILKKKLDVKFSERDNKIVIKNREFIRFVDNFFNYNSKENSPRLSNWLLNTTKDVKKAFISTFVHLQGNTKKNKIKIELPNSICIEQLNYLLLSFNIFCKRKSDKNEKEGLIITGKRNISRFRWIFLEYLSSTEGSLKAKREENKKNIDKKIGSLSCSYKTNKKNIVWSEIKKKEKKDYEGLIIDLSVPENRNFIGGYGAIYIHNTLASFSSIINELLKKEKNGTLKNSVYCLYISPLKSLANDIHRNLEIPLNNIEKKEREKGKEINIKHAIRHGDTKKSERRKMLKDTPHILNTTPETLGILLNSPRFREKLKTVNWVIVDEIHALADNKRGTHLSVSLERLERMCNNSFVRIGCSATVEPLEKIAKFLVGWDPIEKRSRSYNIVDSRFVRNLDLKLECPTEDLIHTSSKEVDRKFYQRLDRHIQNHESTLIFTNTRSGAERVLHNLRESFGDSYDEFNSGCHHGSLGKNSRKKVEEGLKKGEMKVVTTSTSLELGVDFSVDLVVQIGSPKSVAGLLQRVGRAGHTLGEKVKGRVLALERDELIECAVMLKKAKEGFIDRIFIPECPQDVLAQHVYGMCINEVRKETDIVNTIKSSYSYRNYSKEEWESLLKYLKADYEGLEEKNVYAKIWTDKEEDERVLGSRGKMARPIYMTNIGTIPDEFSCDVFIRGTDEWVGDLDESYLDKLQKGDVFVLGGQKYKFRYRRGSKVYVDITSEKPTVPSWFSERLPLSYDLGKQISKFKSRLTESIENEEEDIFLSSYPLDKNSKLSILNLFNQQLMYSGKPSISTDNKLIVEEVNDKKSKRRSYYFHSFYGRKFNDGLSRIIGYEFSRRTGKNVKISVSDNGFVLSIPEKIGRVDIHNIIDDLKLESIEKKLREALEGTELLKRYFRINATRSLMILKNYKGYEKSTRRQQVDSEMLLNIAKEFNNFAVLEETYRECMEDKLDLERIKEELNRIKKGELKVHIIQTPSPSPMAFGLATLSDSDTVLAEDRNSVLKEFHKRIMEEIEGRK